MALELQSNATIFRNMDAIESGNDSRKNFDDDGREKRTGTLLTASAHIITAVIGSGVLSLAWAIAQLGWIAGPLALMIFSTITWFMSTLLADCYRSPDPVTGKRNYTYMEVVRANLGHLSREKDGKDYEDYLLVKSDQSTPSMGHRLFVDFRWLSQSCKWVSLIFVQGGIKIQLCGIAQYGNLIGVTIGYTITASISMAAIQRSNCFHRNGHDAKCYASNNAFMMIFASIQIVLSQIPNFHEIWFLSIIAALMSFAYSSIGLGLSIAKVAGGGHVRTTLTGVTAGVDVSGTEKVWRTFQALGDIAFAYAFSTVLIEIQDTLKSTPPENKVMKKATFIGVTTTTIFYMLCGCAGYAAFGNDAPGNFLTGFGFYEPFWLVDLANVCIAIHLIGAYQVFCQPIFQFVEMRAHHRWPESRFLTAEHAVNFPLLRSVSVNFFRLVWRTAFVIITAVIAMIFPFFNDFVALLGAFGFWPLTVYFPTEMYLAHHKIKRFSATWTWLKVLSGVCLIVSVAAAAGSIQGLAKHVVAYKPFQTPH